VRFSGVNASAVAVDHQRFSWAFVSALALRGSGSDSTKVKALFYPIPVPVVTESLGGISLLQIGTGRYFTFLTFGK
jgi:hypothetical protein